MTTTTTEISTETTTAELPFSVNLWGSHPSENNDDCWTGVDFATLDEAVACYRAIVMWPNDGELPRSCGYDWEFVEITGPDVHEVTANRDQVSQSRHRHRRLRERSRGDAEWRREIATQAGMGGGVDWYNDEMGY